MGADAQTPRRFEPLTAREALLAIRYLVARQHTESDFEADCDKIDLLAIAGLDRQEPPNFELTDQLADRLAKAHKLLRGLQDAALQPGSDAELIAQIPAALALPPDLEAMVERRIGPS